MQGEFSAAEVLGSGNKLPYGSDGQAPSWKVCPSSCAHGTLYPTSEKPTHEPQSGIYPKERTKGVHPNISTGMWKNKKHSPIKDCSSKSWRVSIRGTLCAHEEGMDMKACPASLGLGTPGPLPPCEG